MLSAREKALVELLAAGHTDASAARRLGISPRTVSYALQSLMDRLEVENRFQLGLALGTLGVGESNAGEETENRDQVDDARTISA
jgi:DNA-binding CsgD family transcriptional regulator